MTKDGSHLSTGSQGEDIACEYLVERGYKILERNVRRKWGELDIICRAPESVLRGTISGSRQKSVPRGTLFRLFRRRAPRRKKQGGKVVFIEVKTSRSPVLRPEENMTRAKQKKLIRTCQLYLTEIGYPLDCEWQIDVVSIVLSNNSYPEIRHIEQAVY